MAVFDYSTKEERTHGPKGYRNYQSFKPWLRDEFSFQCAYCLCREKWFPDGEVSFSVDHLSPVSRYPELKTAYENLVYACCYCNSLKGETEVIHLLKGSEQLQVDETGFVTSDQIEGNDLIEICRLNRPALVEFRKGILEVVVMFRDQGKDTRQFLGYPDSLPNLALLKPPAGNSKPEGIFESAYHKRQQGLLPDEY